MKCLLAAYFLLIFYLIEMLGAY